MIKKNCHVSEHLETNLYAESADYAEKKLIVCLSLKSRYHLAKMPDSESKLNLKLLASSVGVRLGLRDKRCHTSALANRV